MMPDAVRRSVHGAPAVIAVAVMLFEASRASAQLSSVPVPSVLLPSAPVPSSSVPPVLLVPVRGTVISRSDRQPIVGAEVIVLRTATRTRTDERGTFRVAATLGDSMRIRALGFRDVRVIATRDTLIDLEPLPTTLATVVTTVGQREIRSAESPASIVVLSKAALASVAAVSANQLLRLVPGLQEIGSPPAQTSIAIRGLDQARVLVLVDGEPVAGAMTENRDIGRLSTLAADRIEVTKGPSSVEFGSEALGGVINLVTAAPSPVFTVDASGRTGELGRKESSAEISNTFGPVGVRLNGGWRQSDRVTAINASSTTLDRVYDFRGDTRIRVSDAFSLRTNLTVSQQRQRWPVGAGFNGFIDNHSLQGFVEAQRSTGAGLLRARIFGQRYAYQFRQALGALPIAGSADSLEQREQLARALLTYSRVIGTHSLDAGAQFSARGIVAPTKIDGDSINDRVTEFFARDAWTLGNVLVTAGARSTSSTLWGDAISPSIGAVWQTAPEWRFRTHVARGFRAPGFKELRYTFINGGAGYQIVGNPNLRPESSWSSSIGGSWAPRNGVAIEVEGYRNALANLITTQNTGTNGAGLLVYENVNVNRARTEGVETNLRLARRNTALSLGYDYLRAIDLTTGKTLDGRAKHTGRVALVQEWARFGGVTTDLSTRYTGASPRGTTTQAALVSIDGQVRVGVTRAMEASFAVANLLDQRPVGYTPAYQRQFSVGLRARWSAAR